MTATVPPADPGRRATAGRTWDTVRPSEGSQVHDERGDIIGSWLVQLLAVMAVVGLFGYELLSVAITTLTVDGDAEEVVDAAADAYGRNESTTEALEAAEEEAARRGVSVADLVVDGERLEVTVTRDTPTLVVHRIPGLEGAAEVAATRHSRWGP